MNIEMLLKQISAVSEKYDSIYQKTGAYFNIFDIANISSNELIICRVIYELINPKGSHFQGDAYLRLFTKYVLNLELAEQDFKDASVFREKIIDNNRRIDLAIQIKDKFIPIEVKIYADDQDDQCYDYYLKAKYSNVYYLTLDGHQPSAKSAQKFKPGNNSYEGISLISFKNEILLWLDKCLEHHETIKIAPIREIILQFAALIRKLTNQMEEGREMEIVKILIESRENMKAALDIEKSLQTCKNEIIIKVFQALEKALEDSLLMENEKGLKIEKDNAYDYDNLKLVHSYYDKKSPTWPGISFLCKDLDKNGIKLWFRIEISSNIFAGFCTPLDKHYNGKQVDEADLQGVLNEFIIEPNDWWVFKKNLPDDDHSPNFKELNDAYLDLFDPDKFKEFINESMKTIKSILDKLL